MYAKFVSNILAITGSEKGANGAQRRGKRQGMHKKTEFDLQKKIVLVAKRYYTL